MVKILGMEEPEASQFLEKISAAAIVNQAILKCSLAELPITEENVVMMIGDFIDPTQPNMNGLIDNIDRTIDEVLETAEIITKAKKRYSDGH